MTYAAACLVLLTVCGYAIQRYQLSHVGNMQNHDVAVVPRQGIFDGSAHKMESVADSAQMAEKPMRDSNDNLTEYVQDSEVTRRSSDATENTGGAYSVRNTVAESQVRPLASASPQWSRRDAQLQDAMPETLPEPEFSSPLARAVPPLRNQMAGNQGMYFPENSQAYMQSRALPGASAVPGTAPAMRAPMSSVPQAMAPQAMSQRPSPELGMNGGAGMGGPGGYGRGGVSGFGGMGGRSSFGMPEPDMSESEMPVQTKTNEQFADDQLNVTASAPNVPPVQSLVQPETSESTDNARQNQRFWSVTIGVIVLVGGVALILLSVVLAVLRLASKSRMIIVAAVVGLLCVFVWITLLRG